MGIISKEVLLGFVIAIFATIGGFYLYLEYISPYDFDTTVEIITEKKLYGKILGIAAIPNLLVFFIFLKKKQDLRAKGVLIATLFTAFAIFVSQFF